MRSYKPRKVDAIFRKVINTQTVFINKNFKNTYLQFLYFLVYQPLLIKYE